MKKKRRQTRIILIIISLGISILFGIYLNRFVNDYYSVKSIELLELKWVGGSAGGGWWYPVFDKNGRYVADQREFGSQFVDFDYIGDSPIFLLPAEIVPGFSSDYANGKTLDPNLVAQGTPLYPLFFSVSVLPAEIRAGESIELKANVRLLDKYPGSGNGGLIFPIDIPQNEFSEVSFFLDAPAFDFSPSNENVPKLLIDSYLQAQQSWAIKPKVDSLGQQVILVTLLAPNAPNLQIAANLEVRKVKGIDPNYSELISFGSAFALFIVAIFGIFKGIPETIMAYRELFGKKAQKKKRKSKRSKR